MRVSSGSSHGEEASDSKEEEESMQKKGSLAGTEPSHYLPHKALKDAKVVVSGMLDDSAHLTSFTVIAISQFVPTWLVLLDGKLGENVHHWTSEEAVCIRRSLALSVTAYEYSSMSDVAGGSWRGAPGRRVCLISGTGGFC